MPSPAAAIDLTPADVQVCPFTVVIDNREGAPYPFTNLRSDASDGNRKIYVPRRFVHLETGDYSIEGCESKICVERKSLEDLFSTLGQGRERFEREHERMAEINSTPGGHACVVVEADWKTAMFCPPEHSRLSPKTVFRTWLAWRNRYGVEWLFMGDRRMAEITTFRILERWWSERSVDNEGTKGVAVDACG